MCFGRETLCGYTLLPPKKRPDTLSGPACPQRRGHPCLFPGMSMLGSMPGSSLSLHRVLYNPTEERPPFQGCPASWLCVLSRHDLQDSVSGLKSCNFSEHGTSREYEGKYTHFGFAHTSTSTCTPAHHHSPFLHPPQSPLGLFPPSVSAFLLTVSPSMAVTP